MIQLGRTHVVPVVNLLHELMLEDPLIHCDETRLQVLKGDKAPTADHWMWVRASGPPGRRIILFDYDASRGGAVPRRLLEGYQGVLLTDGYERPVSPGHRVRVRADLSTPIMVKFHAWLEALAPKVLPQSLLGRGIHYTLGQWPKLTTFLVHGEPLDNNRCENAIRPFVVGRNYPRFVIMEGRHRHRRFGSRKDRCRASSSKPIGTAPNVVDIFGSLRTMHNYKLCRNRRTSSFSRYLGV
jgi:hypothetical protein